MKKALQLAVLSSTFISAAYAGPLVIYGEDNRQEVFDASEAHQLLAKSTATMIGEDKMTRDPAKPGLVQFDQHTLKDWLEGGDKSESEKLFSPSVQKAAAEGVSFCDGTRFIEQANPAMCSGFLIAPDLIVTAGHCVELENFCQNYRWVFDFKLDKDTKLAGVDVKEENIYKCKRVVSSTLSGILNLDYGVIQLDRPVLGRAPLEIRNDLKVTEKQSLVVIGNPSGLPTKVAPGAAVRSNVHPNYFSANLDTFQGNSGSAVFNADTGVVEGILVRGEEDFVPNYEKRCIEPKLCANDECRGEDVTRMTTIPEVGMQKVLNAAATSGNVLEMKKILKTNLWIDFYTKDGQSALIKASAVAQALAMTELLSRGAEVNLQDANGNSSLHVLSLVLTAKNASALKALTDAKINLELRNAEGETALLTAGKKLNLAGVKLLIAAGADKDVTDLKGEGLLAAFIRQGDKKAIKELTALGVRPTPTLERIVQN